MVDTFTLHSLVRYAYQESGESETLQIRELEKSEPAIAEEILNIREAKKLLPQATFYPAAKTLENILRHSRMSGHR